MINARNAQYRVVRPSAGIVSKHRTLGGAKRSLSRQRAGSKKQGGYCQDYIERMDLDGWSRIAE